MLGKASIDAGVGMQSGEIGWISLFARVRQEVKNFFD
jgi:hypothetical protein